MFAQVQLDFVFFAQLVGQFVQHLSNVIENYAVFQELWLEYLDYTKKARILGVEAQMKTFNYLFCVLLGEVILRNTDNLSHTFQHQHLYAAEG